MGALSVYLDANVLVAFFTVDVFSARAIAFLQSQTPALLTSDFTAAEFASAVGRRVRMGDLTCDQALLAFGNFDIWVSRVVTRIEATGADIRAAERMLRRLDLNLRTPDAINIAIAQRVGAELATFDTRMADNARVLGLPLTPLRLSNP